MPEPRIRDMPTNRRSYQRDILLSLLAVHGWSQRGLETAIPIPHDILSRIVSGRQLLDIYTAVRIKAVVGLTDLEFYCLCCGVAKVAYERLEHRGVRTYQREPLAT